MIEAHTLVWQVPSVCPFRHMMSECLRSIPLWLASPLHYHLSRWTGFCCCQRVVPFINNTCWAVLVRGYTGHSPRISCAPSIVSAPLTLSAARHSSNVLYLEPSPEGKSRHNRKTGSTTILIIVHSSMCHHSLYMLQKKVTRGVWGGGEEKIHKKSPKPSSSSKSSNCLHQPSARM